MWVQGLMIGLQFIPELVKAVAILTKQIEPESPVGGGDVQKNTVKGLIRTGIQAADKFDEDGDLIDDRKQEAILGMADRTIDLMVDLYNVTGTFSKSHRGPSVDVEVQTTVSATA